MRLTMYSFIIFNILFVNFIFAEDVGDDCVPNDKFSEGVCTMVNKCDAAVKAIKDQQFHQFNRCGFSGFQEVVCCPRTTDKFGTDDTRNVPTTERTAERECKKILSSNRPTLDLHILGGELASLGEFPHMVALGYDKGFGYEFNCGGSLLSNTYVLTAVHCVDTLEQIAPSIVRAGVVDIGGSAWDPDTDYRISEIITYPNYTRKEKYHDIALLRLETPVQLSSYVSPVCLQITHEDPTTPLTVTGWGRTSNTRDTKSKMLLKANLRAVSNSKCGESYNTGWRKLPEGIIGSQICAGDPEGLKDACQGDSGGPLLSSTKDGEYRLVGLTSFGRGCGSPIPGVYTRVSQYLDWIESVVWPK